MQARAHDRAGERGAAWVSAVVAVAMAACGSTDRPARAPARAAGDGAAVVSQRRVAPRLVDVTVRSPALGRTAKVRLLTPDGWSAGTRRRWPVLYLLHGCCDTYESWTRSTRIEDLRGLRDVLVVMPEGGDVGFYSNWQGHGRGGAPGWETFHLVELRRLLERRYGAGTRRAVAGLSMGGLGAMAYAARHRGLFAAAASFSGLLQPRGDARGLLALFGRYTPDPLAVWGRPRGRGSTWAAHDPTALARRLRGLPLFVSSGNGEPGPLDRARRRRDPVEATVDRESHAFTARLRRLRIRATTDFYGRGTHDWPYWERELERALPMLRRALFADRSG